MCVSEKIDKDNCILKGHIGQECCNKIVFDLVDIDVWHVCYIVVASDASFVAGGESAA